MSGKVSLMVLAAMLLTGQGFKLIGATDATAIEAVGNADATILKLILETLPKEQLKIDRIKLNLMVQEYLENENYDAKKSYETEQLEKSLTGIQEVIQEEEYVADAKTADATRMFQVQKAGFDMVLNAKKDESELVYELQGAKENQNIRSQEIEIEVVKRRKQIDIEEKEVFREEKELVPIVKQPTGQQTMMAEAENIKLIGAADVKAAMLNLVLETLPKKDESELVYELQGVKENQNIRSQEIEIEVVERRKQIIEEKDVFREEKDVFREEKELVPIVKQPTGPQTMMAEAENIKLIGAADVKAVMLNLMLETLPKIAAEVAAPLSKTEEIVILGDDKISVEVTRLLNQLPPAVNALTGVDLSKVLAKIPGAQARQFKHNLPMSHFTAATRVNQRSLS